MWSSLEQLHLQCCTCNGAYLYFGLPFLLGIANSLNILCLHLSRVMIDRHNFIVNANMILNKVHYLFTIIDKSNPDWACSGVVFSQSSIIILASSKMGNSGCHLTCLCMEHLLRFVYSTRAAFNFPYVFVCLRVAL